MNSGGKAGVRRFTQRKRRLELGPAASGAALKQRSTKIGVIQPGRAVIIGRLMGCGCMNDSRSPYFSAVFGDVRVVPEGRGGMPLKDFSISAKRCLNLREHSYRYRLFVISRQSSGRGIYRHVLGDFFGKILGKNPPESSSKKSFRNALTERGQVDTSPPHRRGRDGPPGAGRSQGRSRECRFFVGLISLTRG